MNGREKLGALLLCPAMPAGTDAAEKREAIPSWVDDSPAMASIIAVAASVTDETTPGYLPPADRIAVFDFDGTLYGERFLPYFDTCFFRTVRRTTRPAMRRQKCGHTPKRMSRHWRTSSRNRPDPRRRWPRRRSKALPWRNTELTRAGS